MLYRVEIILTVLALFVLALVFDLVHEIIILLKNGSDKNARIKSKK